jgi:Predicted nucleoside-diphosphate-sugar epimerases
LLDAFEGASQVLLVSSGILGEAGIRQHRNAINAVKKSGAARILYTSHMGSSRASLFPPMLHHAATEELLEQSGMPFTSLRNGFYASSLLWLISDAITSGELLLPEDGPFAWTTHSDLAEAAAAMVSQRPWDGMSPNLTASEAFDMEEVAAMTSNIIGRPIRRIVVSDEEYKERLSAQGVPEFRLEIAMGMFLASRRGEFAKTSTALANLIGRPPVKLSNFLKEAITAPNL